MEQKNMNEDEDDTEEQTSVNEQESKQDDTDDLPSGPSGDPSTWEDLGEEEINTDTEHEFSMQDGKEVNLDTGEEGHSNGDIESAYWSDSDDAQDLKDELDHDYSNAYTGTIGEDGKIDYDIIHNAGVALGRGEQAIADKISDGLKSLNRTLGGTSFLGFTNADLERNKEARNAKETYREIEARQKKALDDFEKKYDKNNKEDVAKYNDLKAQYEETVKRGNAIDAGLYSTDTGSRLGNIWGNVKEDLGDAGTRINQFFGGSNEYGLGAHGQVNDRNGDGKTSIGERLLNMGRDVRDWAIDKAQGLNTGILLDATLGGLGPLGWFATPVVNAGIDRGIDAIKEYAKNHPYNLTAEEKAALAKEEEAMQNAPGGESSDEEKPIVNISTPKVMSVEKTPEASRIGNWDTKALQNMSTSGRKYGWNKTNDVMGHSTSALSDACFKDFFIATMTDNKTMQNVIKTNLMLNYFK